MRSANKRESHIHSIILVRKKCRNVQLSTTKTSMMSIDDNKSLQVGVWRMFRVFNVAKAESSALRERYHINDSCTRDERKAQLACIYKKAATINPTKSTRFHSKSFSLVLKRANECGKQQRGEKWVWSRKRWKRHGKEAKLYCKSIKLRQNKLIKKPEGKRERNVRWTYTRATQRTEPMLAHWQENFKVFLCVVFRLKNKRLNFCSVESFSRELEFKCSANARVGSALRGLLAVVGSSKAAKRRGKKAKRSKNCFVTQNLLCFTLSFLLLLFLCDRCGKHAIFQEDFFMFCVHSFLAGCCWLSMFISHAKLV